MFQLLSKDLLTHTKTPIVIMVLTFLLGCLTLNGCGFKLRGYETLPEAMQRIKISPNQPSEPFQRNLIRVLKQNKVIVVPFNKNKTTLLSLDHQGFTEETISYAPDGSPSRKRLIFTVTYHMLDQDDQTLIEKKTLESTRDFSVSTATILSDQTERQTLQETLWLETAHKMLRQIAQP
jgi:LPS-assembly lipoprotein